MISDRTRTVIIGVVTVVWAMNFLAGLIPAVGYEPDQTINGIFMAIVGGLFALGAKSNNNGGNGNSNGQGDGKPTGGALPPGPSSSPQDGAPNSGASPSSPAEGGGSQ